MSRAPGFVISSLLAGVIACNNPTVMPADEGGTRGGGGNGGDSSGGGAGGSGGGNSGSGSGGSTQPKPGFGFAVPDGGASAPPPMPSTCAASSAIAQAIPLDVFLLVDISGSMNEQFAGQSKWQMVRSALVSFLTDQGSSGLGAGLQFFPKLRGCSMDMDCGGSGLFALQCVHPAKCVRAGQSLDDALDCATQDDCFRGTCTPIGFCPSTGASCQPIGQPCVGGMASELCTAIQPYCDDPFGAVDQAICDGANYTKPVVEIAALPPNAAMITNALHGAYPQGGTPMAAAVTGAYKYIQGYMTAHPGRKAVLVLATDGEPMGCDDNDVAGPAAMALAGTPSVSTYAIGVFASTDQQGPNVLADVAMKGGTGMPIVLQAGANLSQAFLAALNQIRGAALPCAFAIPQMQSGAIDFTKVNFHFEGASGAEDLPYVGSAGACDPMKEGWYYNVDPKTGATPTQVILCPAACTKVKADGKAKVSLTFGCQTKVIQ